MLANLLILLVPVSLAVGDYNYTFGGNDWGGLCKTGSSQSPINAKYSRTNLPYPGSGSIQSTFVASSLKGGFTDDGLSLTGTFGSITFDDASETFTANIVGLNFFAPAQHYINNRKHALEVNLVLDSQPTGYTAYSVALFFNTGATSSFMSSLSDYFAQKTATVNLSNVMSANVMNYYEYVGSMPIPPCTEKVRWFLIPEIQTLNSTELKMFTEHWAGNKQFAGGRGNTRYIQGLNGRTITYYRGI